MPSSNASDLTEALMSLPRELLRVPPAGDPLEAMSLGHTDHVNHLVGSEDLTYGDLLLEVVAGEVNFVGNGSSVQLDFHDVGLLLPSSENLHLGVGNNSDGGAVLLYLLEFLLDFLLAQIVSPLGESLLLALRPVLVESSFGFLSNMFCPNSFQGTQSPWGFNVSDHSDAHDGRSLDDGDS